MSERAPTPPDPERILLVRTSAMGDLAQALPVLTSLRRRFPAARIGWVVDEAFAPLLAGHGLLDELIPAPLRRWRRRGQRGRGGELVAMLGALRRFDAQVAIDLMGSHKGALLARLSGAPIRIGARRRDRREPASRVWINRPVAPSGLHAAERMRSLLAPLGVAAAEPLDFAPEQLACGNARRPSGDYVFLHPGAAWGNKRYPPELWGRVARGIAERAAAAVRVGAAPGEEDLAQRVVAASGGSATRLEAPSLDHLVGALRGARLVLAGDTGAAHWAAALGVPVLALHGPTDPERHGPTGVNSFALTHRLPCSFCHLRMPTAKACLLGIDPELVVARAVELLAPAAV